MAAGDGRALTRDSFQSGPVLGFQEPFEGLEGRGSVVWEVPESLYKAHGREVAGRSVLVKGENWGGRVIDRLLSGGGIVVLRAPLPNDDRYRDDYL
jgi:hypothetical protein